MAGEWVKHFLPQLWENGWIDNTGHNGTVQSLFTPFLGDETRQFSVSSSQYLQSLFCTQGLVKTVVFRRANSISRKDPWLDPILR